MEENSINIINRGNGTLTGEKAQALPVKFIGNWKWTTYLALGFALAILIGIIFISTITKQVVSVEVSGKADNFSILEVK